MECDFNYTDIVTKSNANSTLKILQSNRYANPLNALPNEDRKDLQNANKGVSYYNLNIRIFNNEI
jgi:hypothetical protein